MKSLCRALLVLDVLYCLLAAAQEGLPGWHMFESVEAVDHELVDRDGIAIDVRSALPRGAVLVDRGELRKVVSFVCRREAARGPFRYSEPSLHVGVTLDPAQGREGCIVHAPR
ncbi:MAG: hypothetical protein JWP97_3402 [Labilithrix sp.]|nr:hypothetical protein [Labilithrix sp.]